MKKGLEGVQGGRVSGSSRRGLSDAISEGEGAMTQGYARDLQFEYSLGLVCLCSQEVLRGSVRLLAEDAPIGPGIARRRSSAAR